MKKGIALGLFAVVALCTAATIQWYSQQTATSSLNDAWGIAVERTAPKAYVYSTIGLLKSHIGTNYILNNNGLGTNTTFYNGLTVEGNGVADGSMKLWNAAGTFGVTFGIDAGLSADTNLFFPSILHSSVENNIFTNLTVNNITNTYSYVTNQYVTFNTNNYSYVTNQYVTTNYVDNDYVTNLTVKNLRTDIAYISNAYITNMTIVQGLNQSTNAWDGPTNNLPMNKMEQYYLTYTPCSITNLSSLPPSTESANVILTITNAADTNITLYLPHAGMIPERTASVTISNASEGVISVRYRPQSKTNAVFRLF